MDQKPPNNQPLPFPPSSIPPAFQSTSLIDAPLAQLPGETPQTEPLYSTVIPRSQRPHPPHQGGYPPSQSLGTMSLDTTATQNRSPPSERVSTTNLRVKYLEQMVSRLDKEKKAMEEEFGRQRKKFMKEMVQAESEAKLAKESISRHIEEIEQLNYKLVLLDSTVGGDQEVVALKRKLQELSHEQSVKTEQLKNDWFREKRTLETDVARLKNDLQLANEWIASRNKRGGANPRDRSKSPSRGRQGGRSLERTKSPSLIAPEGVEGGSLLDMSSTPAVNFSSESSLESSMLEAAKESQLLRNVVVPLEEEIDLLRIQLREAQERLEIYEDNPATPTPDTRRGSNPTSISPAPTSKEDVSEKELLEKLLNQEREARHDMEMHADGLRRQKTFLLADIEKLKEELQESKLGLKQEQEDHKQLQKIWETANLQFIETQDSLRDKLLELQHEIKQDEAVREHNLQESGGVSPSSPVPLDHTPNDHTLPHVSSLKRRSSSLGGLAVNEWAGSLDSTDSVSSWKPVAEQLQRLVSSMRKELDSKEEMIEEYRRQLERVQGQLMKDISDKDDEIDRIRAEHDKIKAAMFRDKKQREDLRRQLIGEKETMKVKIEYFQSQERKMKSKLKLTKDKFTEMKHEIQKEMTQFTDERVRLNELLEQKKEEYDCLKDVNSVEMTEYQANMQRLQQLRDEAEMNVASTMEELSRVREREVNTEASLKADIGELRQTINQLEAEKQALNNQLFGLQSDILEVQKVNNRLEKECNNLKMSRSALQDKSRTFIEDQQQQITRFSEDKARLELSESDLQAQLMQLKQQLQTSEANQRDFVELSQSLQVRLAEIEGDPQSDSNKNATADDDLFS